MQRIDPEKREEWDAMLEDPLPGREPSPAVVEAEGQSFMALMGAVAEREEAAGGD